MSWLGDEPSAILDMDGHDEGSTSSPSVDPRSSKPSACLACRTKHLKCDGHQPCSRCRDYRYECRYIKSRRGWKGPRRDVSRTMNSGNSITNSTTLTHTRNPILAQDRSMLGLDLLDVELFNDGDRYMGLDNRQKCLEAFFHFFYRSHPFLPPKEQSLNLLATKRLPLLGTAMCYIGSIFVQKGSTADLALELEVSLTKSDIPNDGHLVQALLLYALGLDGTNNQVKALETLARAQKLALQLGMQRQDFAVLNGGSCHVTQESWRRTWWELYVVDALFAGLHQISTFSLYQVSSDVFLPCEDDAFGSKRVPELHRIDEFDNALFMGMEFEWSSYAYRIVAARNLGHILQHNHLSFLEDSLMARLDNTLVNWELHLPNSKREYFNSAGQVDELLFQAHMITEVSSILLHRRYSDLQTSAATSSVRSCAPPFTGALELQCKKVHTAKSLGSALKIAKLVASPTPLVRHTHFFICAVALASVVQLFHWSFSVATEDEDDLKGQISINIGALKALAEVWQPAFQVLGQVKYAVEDIFLTRTYVLDSLIGDVIAQPMIQDDI